MYVPHNRMDDVIRRKPGRPRKEPPEVHPIERVPMEPPPEVLRCPHCGSARGMEHVSGGRGEPHKQCRACGAVWCVQRVGQLRRVR